MTFNKWTVALAAAGAVSIGSVVQAEEQHQLMTALSSTTISGYVESSAIWEPGTDNTNTGRGNAGIPGRVFDGSPSKLDGFNLHAVKLVIEKPLDEGQWSAGYKADLVFGPDADYYATRLNNGGLDNGNFSVKQAYVALRAPVGNGLDIKLGVWDTIIGYEVFESGNNPNFSRSLGFAIEPTHHTGVLASYKINDMFTVQGGVADAYIGGVNDRANIDTDKTYLGSLTITLPESAGAVAGSAIYLGGVYGHSAVGTGAGALPPTTSLYVGATVNTGLAGLAVGAAFDWRHNGATAFAGAPSSRFNHNDVSIGALYVTYAATEKLKLAARAEYANGSDGTFFDNSRRDFNDEEEFTVTHKRNKIGELTFTADYSLWANVITRAEVRWDHGFNGHPYGGSDEARNAVTLAADLIYKF